MKRFKPENIEQLDPYIGKNLTYRFEGNKKIVSVEYETIVDLLNGIMQVSHLYNSHGFVQEVVEFLSPQNMDILNQLDEMKEVLYA